MMPQAGRRGQEWPRVCAGPDATDPPFPFSSFVSREARLGSARRVRRGRTERDESISIWEIRNTRHGQSGDFVTTPYESGGIGYSLPGLMD
jgi:hypothetical protein